MGNVHRGTFGRDVDVTVDVYDRDSACLGDVL